MSGCPWSFCLAISNRLFRSQFRFIWTWTKPSGALKLTFLLWDKLQYFILRKWKSLEYIQHQWWRANEKKHTKHWTPFFFCHTRETKRKNDCTISCSLLFNGCAFIKTKCVCVVYFISRLSNWMHFNHEKHTDKIKDEVEKNGSESSLWNYYFFSRLCICFSFWCTTPFHQFQQRNDCKEEPNCVYAIFRRETTDDGNRSLRLWQE